MILWLLLGQAVLEKAPFGKWLRKKDNWTAEILNKDQDKLMVVTLVAGHYIYYDQKVRQATLHLYDNLRMNGIVAEPQNYVVDAIKKEILRYVDNFNLRGSTTKILTAS